ncbi:hypothetical protein K2Q02_02665 [Patescibacteria group bacterium]|nr:hypothetical protein [Patescibacteria group bacterium]
MADTIELLADKVCYQYQLAKAKKEFTGKQSNLFTLVCESIYKSDNLHRMYESVSAFKKAVSNLINARRPKKKKNSQPVTKTTIREIPKRVPYISELSGKENDGLAFTQAQIENFGLNPDSY